MAFTRVVGPGIHTQANIDSHNIHSTGIITAVSFVGDGSGLTGVASTDYIITGTAATFTGGVDINSDLDVDGHTNLDNVSIAGVSTFTGNSDFSSGIDVTGAITNTITSANTNMLTFTANMGSNNNRTLIFKSPVTDSTVNPFRIYTNQALEVNVDSARTLFIHESGQVRLHHAGSTDAKSVSYTHLTLPTSDLV